MVAASVNVSSLLNKGWYEAPPVGDRFNELCLDGSAMLFGLNSRDELDDPTTYGGYSTMLFTLWKGLPQNVSDIFSGTVNSTRDGNMGMWFAAQASIAAQYNGTWITDCNSFPSNQSLLSPTTMTPMCRATKLLHPGTTLDSSATLNSTIGCNNSWLESVKTSQLYAKCTNPSSLTPTWATFTWGEEGASAANMTVSTRSNMCDALLQFVGVCDMLVIANVTSTRNVSVAVQTTTVNSTSFCASVPALFTSLWYKNCTAVGSVAGTTWELLCDHVAKFAAICNVSKVVATTRVVSTICTEVSNSIAKLGWYRSVCSQTPITDNTWGEVCATAVGLATTCNLTSILPPAPAVQNVSLWSQTCQNASSFQTNPPASQWIENCRNRSLLGSWPTICSFMDQVSAMCNLTTLLQINVTLNASVTTFKQPRTPPFAVCYRNITSATYTTDWWRAQCTSNNVSTYDSRRRSLWSSLCNVGPQLLTACNVSAVFLSNYSISSCSSNVVNATRVCNTTLPAAKAASWYLSSCAAGTFGCAKVTEIDETCSLQRQLVSGQFYGNCTTGIDANVWAGVICGNRAIADFGPVLFDDPRIKDAIVQETGVTFCSDCLAKENSTLLVRDNYFESVNVSRVDAVACLNCHVVSDTLAKLPQRPDVIVDYGGGITYRNVNATPVGLYGFAGLLVVENNTFYAHNGPVVRLNGGKNNATSVTYTDAISYCSNCSSTAPNGMLWVRNNSFTRGAPPEENEAPDNATKALPFSLSMCTGCRAGGGLVPNPRSAMSELIVSYNVYLSRSSGAGQASLCVGCSMDTDGLFFMYHNLITSGSTDVVMMRRVILRGSRLHVLRNHLWVSNFVYNTTNSTPSSCFDERRSYGWNATNIEFSASLFCGNILEVTAAPVASLCKDCTAVNTITDVMTSNATLNGQPRLAHLNVIENDAFVDNAGRIDMKMCDGCEGNVNVTMNSIWLNNWATAVSFLTACWNCRVSPAEFYNTTLNGQIIAKSANLFYVQHNTFSGTSDTVTLAVASMIAAAPTVVCGNNVSVGTDMSVIAAFREFGSDRSTSDVEHNNKDHCHVPDDATWSVVTNNSFIIQQVTTLELWLCANCGTSENNGRLRVVNHSIVAAPSTTITYVVCQSCAVNDDGEFSIVNNELIQSMTKTSTSYLLHNGMGVVHSIHRVHWNHISVSSSPSLRRWYYLSNTSYNSLLWNLRDTAPPTLNRYERNQMCSSYLWEEHDNLSLVVTPAVPRGNISDPRTPSGSFTCGNVLRFFSDTPGTVNVTLQARVTFRSGNDSVIERNDIQIQSVNFEKAMIVAWCMECLVQSSRLLLIHNAANLSGATIPTATYLQGGIYTQRHPHVVANNPIVVSPFELGLTVEQKELVQTLLLRTPQYYGILSNESMSFNNSIIDTEGGPANLVMSSCYGCQAQDQGTLRVAHNNVSAYGRTTITFSLCATCSQLGSKSVLLLSHNFCTLRNTAKLTSPMLYSDLTFETLPQLIHHNLLHSFNVTTIPGFIVKDHAAASEDATLLQCPPYFNLSLGTIGETCGNLLRVENVPDLVVSLMSRAVIRSPVKVVNNTMDLSGSTTTNVALCRSCAITFGNRGRDNNVDANSMSKTVIQTASTSVSASLSGAQAGEQVFNVIPRGIGLLVVRNVISAVSFVTSANAILLDNGTTDRNALLSVYDNTVYIFNTSTSQLSLVATMSVTATSMFVGGNVFSNTFVGRSDDEGSDNPTSFLIDDMDQLDAPPVSCFNNTVATINISTVNIVMINRFSSGDAVSSLFVSGNRVNIEATCPAIVVTVVASVGNVSLHVTNNSMMSTAARSIALMWVNGWSCSTDTKHRWTWGSLTNNFVNASGLGVEEPTVIASSRLIVAPDDQVVSSGHGSSVPHCVIQDNVALLHTPTVDQMAWGLAIFSNATIAANNVLFGTHLKNISAQMFSLSSENALSILNNSAHISNLGNVSDNRDLATACLESCSSYSTALNQSFPDASFFSQPILTFAWIGGRMNGTVVVQNNHIHVNHIKQVQCSACRQPKNEGLFSMTGMPLMFPFELPEKTFAMIDVSVVSALGCSNFTFEKNTVSVTDIDVSICDAYYNDHPVVYERYTLDTGIILRSSLISSLYQIYTSVGTIRNNTMSLYASLTMPATPHHHLIASIADGISTSFTSSVSNNSITVVSSAVCSSFVVGSLQDDQSTISYPTYVYVPTTGSFSLSNNTMDISANVSGVAVCCQCYVSTSNLTVMGNDVIVRNSSSGSAVVCLTCTVSQSMTRLQLSRNLLNFLNVDVVNASVGCRTYINSARFALCGNTMRAAATDDFSPSSATTASICATMIRTAQSNCIGNKIFAMNPVSFNGSLCRDCTINNTDGNPSGLRDVVAFNNSVQGLYVHTINSEFFSGAIYGDTTEDEAAGFFNMTLNTVTYRNVSDGSITSPVRAATQSTWMRAASIRNEYTFDNANVTASFMNLAQKNVAGRTFYIHSNMLTASPTAVATITTSNAVNYTGLLLSNTMRVLTNGSDLNFTFLGGAAGAPGSYYVTSNTITIPAQPFPDTPGADVLISQLTMTTRNLTIGTLGANSTFVGGQLLYVLIANDGNASKAPVTRMSFTGVIMEGLVITGDVGRTIITITSPTFGADALVALEGATVNGLQLTISGSAIAQQLWKVQGRERFGRELSTSTDPQHVVSVINSTLVGGVVNTSSTTLDLNDGAFLFVKNATVTGGSFSWDAHTAAHAKILLMENASIINSKMHILDGTFTGTKELLNVSSDSSTSNFVLNVTKSSFAPAVPNSTYVAELGNNSNLGGGMTVYFDRSVFNNFVAFHHNDSQYRLQLACTKFDGLAGVNMRREVYAPFYRPLVFRELAWDGSSCYTYSESNPLTSTQSFSSTVSTTKSDNTSTQGHFSGTNSSTITPPPTPSYTQQQTQSLDGSLTHTTSLSGESRSPSKTFSPSGSHSHNSASHTRSHIPTKSSTHSLSQSPSLSHTLSPSKSLSRSISRSRSASRASPTRTESISHSHSETGTFSFSRTVSRSQSSSQSASSSWSLSLSYSASYSATLPLAPFGDASWQLVIVLSSVLGGFVLLAIAIVAMMRCNSHRTKKLRGNNSEEPFDHAPTKTFQVDVRDVTVTVPEDATTIVEVQTLVNIGDAHN